MSFFKMCLSLKYQPACHYGEDLCLKLLFVANWYTSKYIFPHDFVRVFLVHVYILCMIEFIFHKTISSLTVHDNLTRLKNKHT